MRTLVWRALAMFVAAPSTVIAQQRLTANDVVERIRQNIGVPWAEQTVDTVKDGDPATRVSGIAVTMMATLDVLQRAAASGANLVITHEPTFYDHLDRIDVLEREHDAVTAAKRAFIRDNRLVVVRMHDHWHRRQPDGVAVGMSRALGWDRYRRPESEFLFTLPATTLAALGRDIRGRLEARTLRVIGDSSLRVTNVALAPGFAGFPTHRQALQRDDVEVLVIGEAHEWETVEYVADAIAAGRKKALIVIGHIPSEQAGMEDFARWLEKLVPEVPVRFVPAADPFWAPN
ncbi:MAG TPA: Nif3-like dinuclear metal center hexameric protein [Gemmatimonadaceae bacterium]|nr:Nif3-like dinuclear metal center hexameric protein [Gemmatimonadaceae bacterium]